MNKRFVRRVTENTLAHLQVINVGRWLKRWDIHVWPLSETNTQFFEHIKTTSGQKINPNMPSGVTGQFRMDLYLHDSRDPLKERENSDRIMHELCHARLINSEWFVKGVHSMVNIRFPVKFWYWDRFKYKRFQLSIIDIRQFL
jgi:hypothetical protein